jgi:thiamine biosynthesis lipoprotein ApbE
MRFRYWAGALLAMTASAIVLVMTHQYDTYTFHYDDVMGTSLDITVRATSEISAARAEQAARQQIDADSRTLSSYDGSSEFSRWFETTNLAVPVSPLLLDVLARFDDWRVRTAGAVDASAEQISRVWRAAGATQQTPSAPELAAAVGAVRQPHWRLDPAAGTATHLDTVPLALNSFTKSLVVDRAARAALTAEGVQAIAINAGGDLVARGGWPQVVGITDPLHNADNAAPLTRVAIGDAAIATSGGYRRGFDIGGRHYSHIVDPRTGQPAGHVLSATVIAHDAAQAGALATAFCVLAPGESERLAAAMPGVEFLLVLADGSRIQSGGWRRLEVRPRQPVGLPHPVASLLAAPQTWNGGMELTVTLDLARQMGRRPYVAVWIENADHVPVRTLALWFDKQRYLPELRAWYRADRLRSLADGTTIVTAVSSATRSPGKYTLTWDGKDQQGKPVPAGTYTVVIEAAREHGTYQITRQDMIFSAAPAHADLPGNAEIAAMSLDYHRLAAAAR